MSTLAKAQATVKNAGRPALVQARSRVKRIALRGTGVHCPICNSSFAGWDKTPRAYCPRCLSAERHRVLWLYLTNSGLLDRPDLRVLHLAPEPAIRRNLGRMSNVRYVSGDLDPKLADISVDVTDILFRDDYFDLVLISHVLEHVPDDLGAMRELRRIIKPDGAVLMQHPIYYGRETYTDPRWVSPEDRQREYGHHEHVRIYGGDFPARLGAAGFAHSLERYRDTFSEEDVRRYGLFEAEQEYDFRGDDIYVCTKSPRP